MSNIENEMRSQFEAWYSKDFERVHGYPLTDDQMESMRDGEWYGPSRAYMNGCWAGWQASRQALVIELPRDVDQFADDDPGRRAFSLHTNTAYRECRKAIESQGVKCK